MEKYDHRKIEKKWQEKWEREGAWKAQNSASNKDYLLIEFPYPSGEGLHVGHIRSWTALDIVARKHRAEGKNVLYPIGWDAFGLPAENYALKTGIHPKISTKENTDNFRRQIKSLGISFDWSREINTTDPKYYKWTQWIFLQLYKHGLAYKAKTLINWCPSCNIGLANEEVLPADRQGLEGTCERCGTPVEKREKEQWMLAITKYAKRLYDDLDTVDYIEAAKMGQRNWIGPSEGAEIDFPLNWSSPSMDLAFASSNDGKLKRMQRLFKEAGLAIILKTPKELGIENFDVVEDGRTLSENSEKKARALAALTEMPVFADDSGFFIGEEKIDPIAVKRNALAGVDEKTLTIEEIAERMQKYYADLATKRGGTVDAEWRNNFCFVTPERFALHVETVRPVILTNESRGKADPYLPLRGLYVSKATGKYVLEQTEEEELIELKPITDGIKKLFTPMLKVFTTRPDTLFGATYMVVAPEHPFVQACLQKKKEVLQNITEVRKYVEQAKKKTEIERTTEGKEKTGVELKGVKAINLANKEEIPIYVADYVLASYGTGAIMAVPAHDERDFAFAKKFGLPIRQVIAPYFFDHSNPPRAGKRHAPRVVVQGIVKHWRDDSVLQVVWKKLPWKTFVIGGAEPGEELEEAVKREVKEETGYKNFKSIQRIVPESRSEWYADHKDENRYAHMNIFLVELADGEKNDLSEEEKEKHDLKWISFASIPSSFGPVGEMSLVWPALQSGLREGAYTGEGILINSAQFSEIKSEEAKKKITEFVRGEWKTVYKLRDWVFSRQRYWGEPIPMTHCQKCGWQPVPEEQLPVVLPEVEKYQPSDTGESPLANIKEWVNTKCPKCGGKAKRETDVMPNWAGSSWYYLRYCDPQNDRELASMEKLQYWLDGRLPARSSKSGGGVDWYNGGMEHTTLHLLYSRFWHKFLYDIGVVPTPEPYAKRTSHGLILAEDGRKMSKSLGNVINPDHIVESHGADALRLYEMFIGPFDQSVVWNTASIAGVSRFLERVWRLEIDDSTQNKIALDTFVKKIGNDIEVLKFNTAVSQLMILLNLLETLEKVPRSAYETFLKLLAPFAPHISNELAEKHHVNLSKWSTYDEENLIEAIVSVAVQVNGKTRGSVELGADATQAEALALARPVVSKWLSGREEVRVIYVPGKILNFVLER